MRHQLLSWLTFDKKILNFKMSRFSIRSQMARLKFEYLIVISKILSGSFSHFHAIFTFSVPEFSVCCL